MSIKYYPSPAIIVRSDLSISECLTKMNENKVGSVLIINDFVRNDLVGIFTERDLLTKFDLIRAGNHWDQAIVTVMTRPVRTLDVSQLNDAPEMMLQLGVRHLPVVLKSSLDGKESLMGVISMRDIFQVFVHNASHRRSLFEASDSNQPKTLVNLVSMDKNMIDFVQTTIQFFLNAEVTSVDLSNTFIRPAQVLVIDIDHLDLQLWTKFLISKNHDPELKLLLIFFNPMLHSQALNDVLSTIDQAEKFWIIKKPVDLSLFYEALKSI